MGGLIMKVSSDMVKIHLHGRLGVLTVPLRLICGEEMPVPGQTVRFYFSYLQVTEVPYDYDSAAMNPREEISPCLLGGTIIQVNDTAAKIEIMEKMGTVAVPRRWLFTPFPLEMGQTVEFYLSCISIAEKRDISTQIV